LYNFWKAHRRAWLEQPGFEGPLAAKDHCLLEFLRSPSPYVLHAIEDAMVRYLCGEDQHIWTLDCAGRERLARLAEINLASFSFFGIQEDYDRSISLFQRTFGFPPPADTAKHMALDSVQEQSQFERVEREPLTGEIRAELARLTQWDRRLYDFAVQLFHRRLSHNQI
jgi:hypothetical protein